MAETLTDSGAVKLAAGANVSTELTAAQYTKLINQAESLICLRTKKNWVELYSTLDEDYKKILEDAASSYAAIGAINYDMSGYYSRQEALTMLNVNWAKFKECLNKLEDDKYKTFLVDGE